MMNVDRDERDMAERLFGMLCDRTVGCEVSGDFTLPDGQPEIRRLLAVNERVLPPAKYVSSSGVECNGTVDYSVLYVGTDGGLWSASFSSEYELEATAEEIAADMSCGVDTVTGVWSEGVVTRVISPKRLSVRSRLSCHIRAYAPVELEPEMLGEVAVESIRKRYGKANCAEVYSIGSDVLELSEEIGGLSEDSRVVSADAWGYVKDIRKSGEGLTADGEICMKLIVCREDRPAEVIERKLPFSELVECERPLSNMSCRAFCSVTDIRVNVDEGRAVCSLSAVLSAVAEKNIECSYISDVYSTERMCECGWTELSLPVIRGCSTGNFSQNERIGLGETSVPEGAELLDIWGAVRFDGCEYASGKYELTGKSKYTILWRTEEEYGTSDVELPVKYFVEGDGDDGSGFDAMGSVISCRGRMDGELLRIDAEIGVSADIFGRENILAVRNVSFGEVFRKEENRMVIYYPAEGEDAWDVAKKYHVGVEELSAEKNYYIF